MLNPIARTQRRFSTILLITSLMMAIYTVQRGMGSHPSASWSIRTAIGTPIPTVVGLFGLLDYAVYRLVGVAGYIVPILLLALGVRLVRNPDKGVEP